MSTLDNEELVVAMRQPTVREQIAAVLDPTALLGLPEIVYRRAHGEAMQETADRLRNEVLAEADRIAAWVAAHDKQVRADERREAWEWFMQLLRQDLQEGTSLWDEAEAIRKQVLR